MISRVAVIGDLVEVWKDIEGELQVIRRHVQGYDLLSDIEKQKVWEEIAGEAVTVYDAAKSQEVAKTGVFSRLKSLIHK